jgi:sulfur carrier protein
MKVLVNGAAQDLADGATVADAVAAHAHMAPERVGVAVNGEVVRRQDWDQTRLADGDRVEVVAAIQGGAGQPGVGPRARGRRLPGRRPPGGSAPGRSEGGPHG